MTNLTKILLVLVVEDNVNDLEWFRYVINKFDSSIQVVTCKTAEDALEYLMSVLTNPDLILLDLALPGGMDGVDFMKTLNENRRLKDIPVAIVTGGAMDIARAHSQNAADYILKPLTIVRFEELIKRLGFLN